MTSILDGLASVLNGVFGAPVTFLPGVGAPVVVQSVFREDPVEVATADGGSVLITAPTWRVPRDAGVVPVRGDRILPGDGRQFRVLNRIGTGSPASDAFVVHEMELVA